MIMNLQKHYTLFILLACFFAACSDDSGNAPEDPAIISGKTVSGVAQITSFEKNTTISIYELDKEFQKTGIVYETEIDNDQGEYSANVKELKSQYALLKASGYYHNFTTNKQSLHKIALYAIVDMNDDDGFNINVLTHLAHKRIIYLMMQKKMTMEKAKKQAESEVLKSFGIDETFKGAGDLDVFENGEQGAALLALSILLQNEILEDNIDKQINDIATDFEEDGTWDDEKTKALIADYFYELFEKTRYSDIQDNIANLYPSIDIPSFDKYINRFWWNNYGLKDCIEKRKNNIAQNTNSNSSFAKKLFICRPEIWRGASDKEKTKYYWPDTLDNSKGKDGDIYRNKTDTTVCYVYDGNKWRKGELNNCTLGLKGCTKERHLEIQKAPNENWYICNEEQWISEHDCGNIEYLDEKWKKTIEVEKDTAGWKDTTEGAIRKGNKTDVIYIFDNKAWRVANLVEASLGGCTEDIQDSIGYVKMRDGQDYINTHGSSCCTSNYCAGPFFTPGHYKCNNLHWEKADKCAIELSRWKNPKEGDSHIQEECGNKCYVFEDGKWRSGNPTECIPGLGGCTKKFNGTMKHGAVIEEGSECNKYGEYVVCEDSVTIVDTTTKSPYICTYPFMYLGDGSIHGHWMLASEGDLELFPTLCTYDTYGRIFSGKNNYYICDKISPKKFTFRKATSDELEEKCSIYNYGKYKTFKGSKAIAKCDVAESNAEIQFYDWTFANDKNQGTMTDPRDSSVYKTIIMDTLTWMAENLNYADSVNYPSMRKHNWCYNNQIDSCKIHGRLYTWSAAIDSVYWSTQGITCGYTNNSKHTPCGLPERVQGICPAGWHLPNSNEWNQLLEWLEKINIEFYRSGFSTDHTGIYFSTSKSYALFTNIENWTYFWSSTDVETTNYEDVMMLQTSSYSTKLESSQSNDAVSVRCVKDD